MTPDSENADHSNVQKQSEPIKKTSSQEESGMLIVSEAKSHHLPSFREMFAVPISGLSPTPTTPRESTFASSQTSINTFNKVSDYSETRKPETRFNFDSIKTKPENSLQFTFDQPNLGNPLQNEKKSQGLFRLSSLLEMSLNNTTEALGGTEQTRSVNLPQPKQLPEIPKPKQSEFPPKKQPKPSKCTCKKSFCLRLYCDCFAKGALCSAECACSDCHNNDKYEEIREVMVKETKEKNPLAFSSKYKRLSGDHQILHSRGCNCSKTGCVKKYCECFNAGTGCSRLCRCTNCRNENIELQDSEIKVYYEKVLRKRRKHSAFIQYLDSKFETNKQEKTEWLLFNYIYLIAANRWTSNYLIR